jgi:hypothetical protein
VNMLPGSQALRSIEQSLSEAKRDLEATNGQIAKVSSAKAELQHEESAAYRELAGLRLDVLARDTVVQDLDASERKARSLLENHQAALAALEAEIASGVKSGESLQRQRAELVERLETLGGQIDEAEAKTQSRLAKDPAFTAQLAVAAEAEAVVKRAERKAERAREDRVEKGKPFEASPLFMYLWERGYDTARYRASAPIRWLDGKVARLCRYSAARPIYSMLVSLPERLGEHVDEVRAHAQTETERLESLEREAMEADGVADLAAPFAEQEAALETLTAELNKQEGELAALQRRRSELIGGGSESYRKALDVLSVAYRQESIRALYRDARATSMPDDDIVVERLEDIAEREHDLQQDSGHLAATQVAQVKRITELEKILTDFRNQRFDSGNSKFSDPNLISLILSQFMKGVLSSGGVWDALRRQQRFDRGRADPGFGSGGLWKKLGRRRGGSPLGPIGGGFGGRSSGGRSSGGRSSGGGGFRTGGTF